MKKTLWKIVLVVAVVCVLAASLSACTKTITQVCKDLNGYLNLSYSKVELTVESVRKDLSLVSHYNMQTLSDGNVKISYDYQVANKIQVGESIVVPEAPVSTKQGYVVVKGNSVVEESGDPLNVELPAGGALLLNFEDRNLVNFKLEEGRLEADVKDAKTFMRDSSFKGEDMHIVVTYDKSIKTLQISYVQDGTSVVLDFVLEV